jgi:TPP-dependent pyruvate/acetoin dehydrogenase alpha subunit
VKDVEQLVTYLEKITRIRLFEERVRELRVKGLIVGSVHLCIGQEAIPVGATHAIDLRVDPVFATYRGHGWAIACGASLEALFAELLGRTTGTNGGRAGSAYLSDPDHGFYGENSIVGGGVPIATGAAIASRFDGSSRVVLCSFGDGALNQGAVHEAFNFAAVMAAPVVFIVENNGYSELTPTADMVRIDRLCDRAAAYGMPGAQVDGNDAAAVHTRVSEAVALARGGGGPTLVEALTERTVGHYIGDAELYRPMGEVERALEREPITKLRTALLMAGVAEARLSALENAVRLEVEQAMAVALEAPLADPETATEGVYA